MLPVIAIVGRPNVGKSTLFNCLTGSRAALVSDLPGMTRDRQYGNAHIDGHSFIVIDTGGFIDDKNPINILTISQSEQAMTEADVILFVVDAREGPTPQDKVIAEKIRPLNKTIYLVVNKTEGLDLNVTLSDFYHMGFETILPIAAAHKSGLSELVEAIFAQPNIVVESADTLSTEAGIKLAIIGRPNVGKSTLTNQMLGEERVIVFDEPGTTRDSIYIPLEREDRKYTLIDTAGVRKRGKISAINEKFSVVKTLQAIESANVVLFIMDAREGVTEPDLKLLGFVLESGRAIVIALNKWDGMTSDARDAARTSIDRRLNFINFARIHFISALHGSGVGDLFQSINEAYDSANKKLSTPQLTKILEQAVHSHTPPLVNGRRIKLRYAHAGGHNPPIIIIHGNQVKSLPESYKRYLSHLFQKRLKLMGTPVEIQLRSGENPFRDKKNPLTDRQRKKRSRLMRHTKKK